MVGIVIHGSLPLVTGIHNAMLAGIPIDNDKFASCEQSETNSPFFAIHRNYFFGSVNSPGLITVAIRQGHGLTLSFSPNDDDCGSRRHEVEPTVDSIFSMDDGQPRESARFVDLNF